MKTFSYMTVGLLPVGELDQVLNAHGVQGWRLVDLRECPLPSGVYYVALLEKENPPT